MTVEEWVKEKLYDHGLFEDDAATVFDIAKLDIEKETPYWATRWNKDISAYPESTLKALWPIFKTEAYKWLKANNPTSWALPMFAPAEGK